MLNHFCFVALFVAAEGNGNLSCICQPRKYYFHKCLGFYKAMPILFCAWNCYAGMKSCTASKPRPLNRCHGVTDFDWGLEVVQYTVILQCYVTVILFHLCLLNLPVTFLSISIS